MNTKIDIVRHKIAKVGFGKAKGFDRDDSFLFSDKPAYLIESVADRNRRVARDFARRKRAAKKKAI